MKNLKRVLSLVLALMMALSLMAFSSSASAAESATIPVASDFSDYNDVNDAYKEAADVTVALGIIKGKTLTTLDPDGTLDRAEAVIMIMRILLGDTAAESMSGSTSRIFLDVGAEFPYGDLIAYAANTGIVSGDAGSKKFFPTDKLNVVSFGKILLGALGYDGDKEGYTGATWYINVFADMATVGIDLDGVTDPFANLTREQAMQMTFQALKSPLVEYPGMTISQSAIATKNGASFVTSNLAQTQTISSQTLSNSGNTYTVEFAEKYFQKLILRDTVDAFGRPTHTWVLNNVTIDSYDDSDRLVVEYDSETTDVKVAADLGNYYLPLYSTYEVQTAAKTVVPVNDYTKYTGRLTYNFIQYNNSASPVPLTVGSAGNSQTIAETIANLTGNGTKVEIYVGDNNVVSNIVVINYAVGTLNIVRPVTNDRTNYAVTNAKWQKQGATTLTGSEFDSDDVLNTVVYYDGAKTGDVVTCAQIDNVLYIYPTTNFTGTQDSKNSVLNTRDTVKVTIDGETYTLGTAVDNVDETDFINSKNSATYYLDQYGFVVFSNKANLSYAYVVAAGGGITVGADGNVPVVKARVVLEDGTVGEYNVALTKKSDGTWHIANDNRDFAIRNTNDPDADDDAKIALVGSTTPNEAGYTVWDYTLDGDNITLFPIGNIVNGNTNATDSLAVKGTAYVGTATSTIKNGATRVVVGKTGNGIELLMNGQTVFVIYNKYNQTASVVTGNTKLGKSELANAKMVAIATSAGSKSEVSYLVFATINDDSDTNYGYAYINVKTGVTNQTAGITTYTGYLPDGTTIYLTDETGKDGTTMAGVVSGSGVYGYDVNSGKITERLATAGYAYGDTYTSDKLTFLAGQKVTQAADGLLRLADGTTVLNNAKNSVYIDDALGSENGAYGFVVRDSSNSIETIFIVPVSHVTGTGTGATADEGIVGNPTESEPGVLTIKYYNRAPSLDQIKAAVESKLGKSVTISMTDSTNGSAITGDGITYTITLARVYALYINDDFVRYVELSDSVGTVSNLTKDVYYLVTHNGGTQCKQADANGEITGLSIIVATDIKVYAAYSVTSANPANATVVAGDTSLSKKVDDVLYVRAGDTAKVTFQTDKMNYSITVGGKETEYTSPKTGSDNAVTVTVTSNVVVKALPGGALPTVPEESSSVLNAIKNLADGVYGVTNIASEWGDTGADSAKEVVAFKFTATETVTREYYLWIYDGGGTLVSKSGGFSGTEDEAVVLYSNLAKLAIEDSGLSCTLSGTWKIIADAAENMTDEAVAPVGTYTWRVTKGDNADENKIVEGTFYWTYTSE